MEKFEENQMILRVPEDLADKINDLIELNGDEIDFLELKPKIIKNKNGDEITQFDFKLGEFQSKASIIELPCVIESHKTLDDINIFKSNNISQMVYVHPKNEDFLEEGLFKKLMDLKKLQKLLKKEMIKIFLI